MTWTIGHVAALLVGSVMAGLLIFDDDRRTW
jgi:hypothetical protein